MEPSPAVVVTGIGLITGFNDLDRGPGTRHRREVTWEALKAGRSAVRSLDWPRSRDEPRYFGCSAFGSGDSQHREVIHDLIAALADEAFEDAGLGSQEIEAASDRTAVLLGLSKGGVRSSRLLAERLAVGSPDDERTAQDWLASWPSSGAMLLARRRGLRGPCLAPIAACATGLVAVIQGADLIRRGVCDRVIAGSADASLERLFLAAFRKMKALSRWEGDPQGAVRPWDRGRSGFVVGEGGALLVLEREDLARERGVLPYAEVKGGALGADAYHETDLNPDPRGFADVITRSLTDSGVDPSAIDHVNVHGTATRSNDPLECQALRLVLGEHAEAVSCSASKSQIGHLLGAAGAAELAITCLSIRDGFIPPTLNLDDPDPACDLDGTPHVGRSRPIRNALKLSIGFGGHLAAVVLARPEGDRRLGVGMTSDA